MKRLVLVMLVAACGDNASGTPWLDKAAILIDGFDETNDDCRTGLCVHDENTDLTIFQGATYLVHRTADSQILGPNSSLRVSRSDDHGASWNLLAIIPAPSDRDIRDPCFFTVGGQLALKAITRLPVSSLRDSGVDSISVEMISPDAGTTWGPSMAMGPEQWSFWRLRQDDDGTWYSAAYHDGDTSVSLFGSADGMTWTQGANIYDQSDDTPLETELVFRPGQPLLAMVRMDGTDDELLGAQGRLRTKMCTAAKPYGSFDCSSELDGARLDGPVAFTDKDRLFVVAREHLLDGSLNKKRTALYEITEDSPAGPFEFVDHGDFPSAGDTSYAGVAPIDGQRYVVTYYSSNILQDPPWVRAILGATDIWQATIDLSKI